MLLVSLRAPSNITVSSSGIIFSPKYSFIFHPIRKVFNFLINNVKVDQILQFPRPIRGDFWPIFSLVESSRKRMRAVSWRLRMLIGSHCFFKVPYSFVSASQPASQPASQSNLSVDWTLFSSIPFDRFIYPL